MSRKRDRQEIELVAEVIGESLQIAVQETITDRSPEPAREAIDELLAIDDEVATDDEGGPAELIAMLTLVRWLSLVREKLADQPRLVDDALAWIEDSLGRRYRARARYTAGGLQSEDGVTEMMMYTDALGSDFIPSLIWLLAGVVARYGDGDADWLRRLERVSLG